ncbi:hypothetical protein [Microcoleus sp.]|uniref:hypothetical protein n=1 Tax=Microcoleus sp. TaxID=44472 RepID=UPI003526AE26
MATQSPAVELNQESKFMKLIHQALIAGCVLAAVGCAGTAQAPSPTFIAGREDNFAVIGDKEPEPAYASDRLKQLPNFVKGRPLMNFDEPGYDKVLAQTFTWSKTRIIAAELTFRAKVSQGGACNDRIRLGFSGDPNPVGFFSFLGAWNDAWGYCNRSGIGPGQELLQNNSWGKGPRAISDYTFTIRLQPALIAKMNQKSYLDVWGEDDTMFDYFKLTLQTDAKTVLEP